MYIGNSRIDYKEVEDVELTIKGREHKARYRVPLEYANDMQTYWDTFRASELDCTFAEYMNDYNDIDVEYIGICY